MIVPAPDQSVFYHKAPAAGPKAKQAFGQSLSFRRTTIPVLLTGGLIVNGLAAMHFLWKNENNPMGGLPIWLLGILFLVGVLLWVLAGANMMVVKHLMAAEAQGK